MRERLVLQDLSGELDREEARGRVLVNAGILARVGQKELPAMMKQLYATLHQLRQYAELDPYAFTASPTQLYVQANMTKLMNALEEANLMQYEEPSDAVKTGHE